MKIYYKYLFKRIMMSSLMMLALLTSAVWSLIMVGTQGAEMLGTLNMVQLGFFILPYNSLFVWPIAMFLGTLITVTQMQQHCELLTLRCLGLSHRQIFAPILLYSAVSAILSYFITFYVAPAMLKQFMAQQQMKIEKAALTSLEKQKLNKISGTVIYFDEIDKEGNAKNLTLWTKDSESNTILVADRLKFLRQKNGTSMIELESPTAYKFGEKQHSISTANLAYASLSAIVKPKHGPFQDKPFYFVGISELYHKATVEKEFKARRELCGRIIRSAYLVIMPLFVYIISARRTTTRDNNMIYAVKYAIALMFLSLFGVTSENTFTGTPLWFVPYAMVPLFLIYGFYRLHRVNSDIFAG